jgi:ankyrin repeat protein
MTRTRSIVLTLLAVLCLALIAVSAWLVSLHLGGGIHRYAYDGVTSYVKIYVMLGGDPDVRDDYGNTLLHLVSYDTDLARSLWNHGADLEAEDLRGETPIFCSITMGNAKLARAYMQWGANVNHADEGGGTPLHRAAAAGMAGTVVQLIDSGANVNAATNEGLTALHLGACEKEEIVAYLLAHGADVNALTENGHTPLSFAHENDANPAVIELLLEEGAQLPEHAADVDTADAGLAENELIQ